jgi:ABC-type lipoprotein export system ATPase subunit
MDEPILELKEVSFSAQNNDIIKELSFQFEKGKTAALVGPSGCGKSTLLKLTAGLLVPSRGEVCYYGRDISTMNRQQNLEFRKEGAVVFQDSALWANQSLYQSLELPLMIHYPDMSKEERNRRITEAAAEVGYKRDLMTRPSNLSMGEQKLIAFARAMICCPTLLFLDEWTESLDDTAAQRLIGLVKRRQMDNNTIIFVSHNLNVIKQLAQIVVMLIDGTIHLTVTAEQIAQDNAIAELLEKGIAS